MINKEFDLTIFFDIDNTLADTFAISGWVDRLNQGDAKVFLEPVPLVDMAKLLQQITTLGRLGVRFGIVTKLPKQADAQLKRESVKSKIRWLCRHLSPDLLQLFSAGIHMVDFDANKSVAVKDVCNNAILFDDDLINRQDWTEGGGIAVDPYVVDITKFLEKLTVSLLIK